MVKVTASIIIKNSKVLIAKRIPTAKLANRWEFPGGKLEDGETPEQCMKREVHEEFERVIKALQTEGVKEEVPASRL